MAENKQYITQNQANGAVMISEDVIATIVSHAIVEVDGVVGLDIKPGSDIHCCLRSQCDRCCQGCSERNFQRCRIYDRYCYQRNQCQCLRYRSPVREHYDKR